MKKLIATITCLVALTITAIPVSAQTRYRSANQRSNQERRYNRGYDSRYDNRVYRDNSVYSNDQYRSEVYRDEDYSYGRDRSVWNKHRDKITTAGGAVGGAILGGLIGGKKGAVIGAITGGAGAAIYTYKIRDKNRRY